MRCWCCFGAVASMQRRRRERCACEGEGGPGCILTSFKTMDDGGYSGSQAVVLLTMFCINQIIFCMSISLFV
jgi:hypothetical protein